MSTKRDPDTKNTRARYEWLGKRDNMGRSIEHVRFVSASIRLFSVPECLMLRLQPWMKLAQSYLSFFFVLFRTCELQKKVK